MQQSFWNMDKPYQIYKPMINLAFFPWKFKNFSYIEHRDKNLDPIKGI